MKDVSVIVIGFGNRAVTYTRYALVHPERMKVKAVIEPNPVRRDLAKEMFSLDDAALFETMDDCLKLGKIADAVINTTMDELHIETAVPFLELGYDMLLEKPITNNRDELLKLKATAEKHGCNLMICHVLRYTPFYLKIKQIIASGALGEITEMETNELVGIPHASSAYIRGKWKNRSECGSSMLLAKCCHDTDLLCWFNSGTRPVKVVSLGGRRYFTEKNAPQGAGTRCMVDCKVEKECPYSCKKMYIDNECFKQYSFTCLHKKYEDVTMQEKTESLKTNNPMGECVYKTNADIVDRQAIIVEFENGSIATHSMVAGVARPGRNVHIIGTLGEIQGFLEENKFTVRTYDAEHCRYDERVEEITGLNDGDGHSGGDSRLVEDFVNAELGLARSVSATVIDDSINGHLIVYAADESLESGGAPKKI